METYNISYDIYIYTHTQNIHSRRSYWAYYLRYQVVTEFIHFDDDVPTWME